MDSNADLEALLRGLEERLLRPDVRSSRAHLEELLAEGFIEFGASGIAYERSDIISMHVVEQQAAWAIVNFKARQLADGLALVTYMAAKSGGGSSLRSSIWKRSGTQWRMVFHQGTPVPRK